MEPNTLPLIAEGKTKIVYANPEDETTVYLCFKDDITAGDGVQRDVFPGKAAIDWSINRDCFEYLQRQGIRTHYLASPQSGGVLCADWIGKLKSKP